MGSFFLTSKRASATLVFLVISILLVSSGVIIVHEVEKSNNENNIVGTGLVLLDTEQDISQYSDSSDDQITFTFGDSRGKTSPKKSSGGGGGSSGEESSTVSEVSNDLILPEINETSDNQTFVNDTEEENLNSLESTNISIQFSDGHIFEENGTTYIMRDGAAYALASSEQIRFNPPLPSSICLGSSGNEKIDIRVLGSLSPVLNFNGALVCLYADYVGADIELKIMEDDLVGDDLIASKTFHVSVNCDNPKVDYSKIFEKIDLSSQFGGLADQSRIEVYGSIKLTSDHLHNIEYSTLTYGVDKEPNCECLSGPCCDLSSRPYEFKPYGSSCGTCKACDSFGSCSKTPSDDSACGIMDCSNWYVKTGTQSPTTNQWCYNKKDITSNRCEAFGNCKDSNTADCGSQSNDQLKYYCGVCKFIRTGDCTGTTRGSCSNYYKHVSCGTNSECDGFGTCVTCTTHSYTNCWDNDVYYYDACDNREEKKLPDCGENSYTDWWLSSYCVGDNLYVPRTYYNRGCQNRVCYVDSLDENVFVKTCANGCSNGGCIIECSSDSDCGENYWNYFCGDGSWGIVDGNAYKMYVERRKQKFFDVNMPIIKKDTQLYGYDLKEFNGRTITYDLTRLLRGKGMLLKLIVKVEGDKALAEPKELKVMPYFIRRMMRKGTNYVEDSFSAECKDAVLKIKPFLITRKKVSRAVRKALREKAKETLMDYVKTKDIETLFDEIMKNQLQKFLSLKLKKIYPLSLCEIRFFSIKEKKENKKE